MTEIKSRSKILEQINKIRNYSVRLGHLETVLENSKDISEEAKDAVEKSAWKLINELNKLTSGIK